MKAFIKAEIDELGRQLNGYSMLLNLKYMNLCVNAEPGSLLPVDINFYGKMMNIEEAAVVTSPRKDQLAIVPQDPEYLEAIRRGVFEAHPEFIAEINYLDDDSPSEEERYLLYTMPEVDKDRRDLLRNGTKGLYEECCARMQIVYTQFKADLISRMKGFTPQEIKETEDGVDNEYKQYKDFTDQIYDDKQKEIEEGYQRYLEKHPEEHWAPASAAPASADRQNQPSAASSWYEEEDPDEGFDVTKGFRLRNY